MQRGVSCIVWCSVHRIFYYMKFILGKKIEMTQKFMDDGSVVPVTVVQAGPCVITQVKREAQDTYAAVQVGFDTKKSLTKSLLGHLKGLGELRFLREFRLSDAEAEQFIRGMRITASVFAKGDLVAVNGTSKGKGFQGVVKRHGFKGAPKTHGNKDQLRMPGSLGAGEPQHVFKGMRMGGRTGGDVVTVHNLQIVEVDADKGLLYVKGALPGHRNSLVALYGAGEMKISAPQEETKPADVTPTQASVVSEATPSGTQEQVTTNA